MNNLIAFVGFKSSGKNTAAMPLITLGDYTAFSFADAIKDALAAIFCWNRKLLEGDTKESRIWREQIDEWWAEKLGIKDFTPRWAMTHFGTQLMRQQFCQNIWLFNVERRILNHNNNIALLDCRFRNEIDLAHRYKGKVIRIKRGPEPDWMDSALKANTGSQYHIDQLKDLGIHESEYDWIGSPIDFTVENEGTIDELHQKILKICPITICA